MTVVKVALPFAFSALFFLSEPFWSPAPWVALPTTLTLLQWLGVHVVFATVMAYLLGFSCLVALYFEMIVPVSLLPDIATQKIGDMYERLSLPEYAINLLIYFLGFAAHQVFFIYRSYWPLISF
jgi:hypothetical protein